jgi:hypothetical protein
LSDAAWARISGVTQTRSPGNAFRQAYPVTQVLKADASEATATGARSPAQADGWIRAATLELTPADRDGIASAIIRTGRAPGRHSWHDGRAQPKSMWRFASDVFGGTRIQ